jgi:hypothetical protein
LQDRETFPLHFSHLYYICLLMEEIHCVLCRTDVGGAASRIKQLVDDHTELLQGVKRLEMEVKVTNFVQKMKV